LLIGRELVRALLAFVLLGVFFWTIWDCGRTIGTPAWKDAKDLLQLLLPPESALVGSAIAFFFGSRLR